MANPRLLVLTNENRAGFSAPGVHDAFARLESLDAIDIAAIESWKPQVGETAEMAAARVISLLSQTNYDILVVLSPRDSTLSQGLAASLPGLIGTRVLAIWEGDPIALWPIRKSMRAWFQLANIVFSQYGQPQVDKILGLGAAEVFHLPATYCHVQLKEIEENPPERATSVDAVMIASNNTKWTSLRGVPGSRERKELARRLMESSADFSLHGNHWPKQWNASPVPFAQQGIAIRRARVSVNWDNSPTFSDSSSNRLPISLLAGRPHITTQHPGMTWIAGVEIGLFQEHDVASVIDRTHQLVAEDPAVTFATGLAAYRWAAGRVSHRESITYMMRCLGVARLPVLPQEPWDLLPGPWANSTRAISE